ncbi:hypothetical protein BESB_035120 [Besnoitia besnoiti]|uniref:Transmembrane protein n=1 Tax=Besnoitia besnoiti TaxID=94643 RepID=A0A2A9MIM9_BESBE|nr:hypothetical protein BESB_035120 [Besnoitia besnoiti]PFH37054.1 hypothetical protein BESB_035120 [Besnoitia besnoiti]
MPVPGVCGHSRHRLAFLVIQSLVFAAAVLAASPSLPVPAKKHNEEVRTETKTQRQAADVEQPAAAEDKDKEGKPARPRVRSARTTDIRKKMQRYRIIIGLALATWAISFSRPIIQQLVAEYFMDDD